MSDTGEESGVVAEQKAVMAEAEDPQQQQQTQQQQQQQQHEIGKPEKTTISLSIWPPTQRTRDAVITRLIETLSSPSVLSKRYGSMPLDEAAAAARLIEGEAFSAASASFDGASGTASADEIEILQLYSKEISKRMLESVKARASSGSPADNASQTPVVAPASSEEIPSVEPESS